MPQDAPVQPVPERDHVTPLFCVSFCTVAIKPCAPPVPTVAVVGEMLTEMTFTMKATPLLATPPTVTTTFPLVAPLGTGTTMPLLLQLVGVASVPLNVTVLVPCVSPKFIPLIVTDVPTSPDVADKPTMLGAGPVTVKFTPLLAAPATVTMTFPVTAPFGTGTTMLVALQLVGVANAALNFNVLAPCVAPKFVPVIVTDAPIGPEVGLRPVIIGEGTTVIVAIADLVGSAAEVAVSDTVGGLGTVAGAT